MAGEVVVGTEACRHQPGALRPGSADQIEDVAGPRTVSGSVDPGRSDERAVGTERHAVAEEVPTPPVRCRQLGRLHPGARRRVAVEDVDRPGLAVRVKRADQDPLTPHRDRHAEHRAGRAVGRMELRRLDPRTGPDVADPESAPRSSSRSAPTTTRSASSATALPNASPPAPSPAVKSALALHGSPPSNTCTAPASGATVSSPRAPITMRPLLSATAVPNWSPGARTGATSLVSICATSPAPRPKIAGASHQRRPFEIAIVRLRMRSTANHPLPSERTCSGWAIPSVRGTRLLRANPPGPRAAAARPCRSRPWHRRVRGLTRDETPGTWRRAARGGRLWGSSAER